MTNVIVFLFGILLSALAGYHYRTLKDTIKRLEAPEPEVGATDASYGQMVYKSNQDGSVGLVEPKTAQRLEWEEQERLRKLQLGPK